MDQGRWDGVRVRIYAVLVGVGVGLVGTAFRVAVGCGYEMYAHWLASAPEQPVPAWVLGALSGALAVTAAVALTRRLAPEAAGSGIQEIEGVLAGLRPALRWGPILVVKFVGGLLALSVGLTLGREGPTIHLGGAVGAAIASAGRLAQQSVKMLIGAGAAAGLAVAFNAPIGGALLAMEELRKEFAFTVRSGHCVLLATVAAVLVSFLLAGPERILPIPVSARPAIADLFLTVPFAIVVGAYGVFLARLLVGTLDALRALTLRMGWLAPALCIGASIGVLVRLVPDLTGGGEVLCVQLLDAPQTLAWVCLLLLLRTPIFAVNYASGTPGGIFAPQLAFGALLGMLYAAGVGLVAPELELDAGRYAVVGMVALLTATVRAPLTGLALVVEMTGNYPLIPMALIASVAADVTATVLGGQPIYETLLARTLALDGRRGARAPEHEVPIK